MFVSIVPTENENGFFHTGLNGINMGLKLDEKVAALMSLLKGERSCQIACTGSDKMILLNTSSSSTAFWMKWGSLFFVQSSLVSECLWRGNPSSSVMEVFNKMAQSRAFSSKIEETVVGIEVDLCCFMRWLSCLLFFSCYPAAPYRGRKWMWNSYR